MSAERRKQSRGEQSRAEQRRRVEERREERGGHLDDGGADDPHARVLAEGADHLRGVRHHPQLLAQAVAVLGRLAAALAEVGHHGVRGVAAEGDGTLCPRAPEPLRVDSGEERRAIVQVAPLDVALGAVR